MIIIQHLQVIYIQRIKAKLKLQVKDVERFSMVYDGKSYVVDQVSQ